MLLPAAALLNGLGLVMVRRLGYANPAQYGSQAPAQALWTTLGVALFVAVIVIVQDYRNLERYRFTFALVATGCCWRRSFPASGVRSRRQAVDRARRRPDPACRDQRIALVIFFAAYLKDAKELLATATYRVGPFLVPEIKYFLPLVGRGA